MLPAVRLPAWRGGRHQLPPSFPRSPGIIPAAPAKVFSGLRATTVLSRNEAEVGTFRCARKGFLIHKIFTESGANRAPVPRLDMCGLRPAYRITGYTRASRPGPGSVPRRVRGGREKGFKGRELPRPGSTVEPGRGDRRH